MFRDRYKITDVFNFDKFKNKVDFTSRINDQIGSLSSTFFYIDFIDFFFLFDC